jgi:hypothetical protein
MGDSVAQFYRLAVATDPPRPSGAGATGAKVGPAGAGRRIARWNKFLQPIFERRAGPLSAGHVRLMARAAVYSILDSLRLIDNHDIGRPFGNQIEIARKRS